MSGIIAYSRGISLAIDAKLSSTSKFSYKVKLIRKDNETSDDLPIEDILKDVDVKINDLYLSGIGENQNVSYLINLIKQANTDVSITITNKDNKKMMFITGSDELSSIDLTVFPNLYEEASSIKGGNIIYVKGRCEKRNGRYQIIVNEIKEI